MRIFAGLLLACLSFWSVGAHAEDASVSIAIKNNKFEPEELHVPARQKVVIHVDNQDATPEEFESSSLKVEKIVPGGTKGIVRIGPLVPGRYSFFGDFHQDSANGVVIAE
ncbi:Cupredoxin-like domain-containing protein [Faunimonas pinastri]|uniref:Cupredoxin-like domain-containing protein n=1 Tax=Faunimonas pinastri TaxID=1855383 RepID=A0A1H9FVJ8_9HYPH|nr:cupredoxin domain-containing protein [Faunimonas pinastri]SEQ41955.1 Cupredoxin-like domain-containing protein [Faunimonas pinastri]